MVTRIKSEKILIDGSFQAGYLYLEEGKILKFSKEAEPADRLLDWSKYILAPGLIDLHCHGALGADYARSIPSEMMRAMDYHLHHGATTQLPTVTSGPISEMEAALERLSCCKHPAMSGVHLEGPYFAPSQCGAQDPNVITAPQEADYKRIIERFSGLIARWSYAPERDEKSAFLQSLLAAKILPSAGHTDALFAEMDLAAEQGCSLVTHLYSCTSTVTRKNCFRRGGVLEAAFLRDDLDVELIADGCHLPSELIRLVHKVKGADHVALVTDALPVAGLFEKESMVGGVPCIVEDGVCKLKDRSAFAGSIATMDRLVRVVAEAGIPLEDALKMASKTPARILGLKKGEIKAGYDADLIALNDALLVCHVISGGKEIR